MKSPRRYAKRAFYSPIGIRLRNLIGFRPVHFTLDKLDGPYSASDFFLWRTDKGMKTKVRVSDIPAHYYGVDAQLVLRFYDHDGGFLKSDEMDLNGFVSDVTVDDAYMGKIGWGYFTAYFLPKGKPPDNMAITNRCYVGFSAGDDFYSYVHGNFHCRAMLLRGAETAEEISAVYPSKRTTHYKIQKNFADVESNELFFVNPLEREFSLNVNGSCHSVGAMSAVRVVPEVGTDGIVTVESDFTFPRPIIFSHKGAFFDVHHA